MNPATPNPNVPVSAVEADTVEAREQQVLDQIADYRADSPLTIDVTGDNGVCVVRLSGELDVATAPELDARIAGVLDGHAGGVVVDLTPLSFLDSKGLACFLRAASRHPGRIAIASPRERITRLFQATGLAERLQVRASLAEAVATVS